jgi:hypothetical protein|tara:strand:- start:36 stop:494 length:459 start_codon:yes stop_codon:yes gene_type:complete
MSTNDNQEALVPQEKKESTKQKSCCWLFKLETGVGTIIYLDILMFGVILMTSFASMRDGLYSSKSNAARVKNSASSSGLDKKQANKKNTSFILFNLVTDYTLIFVMLVKMYFAIIYGYKILHNGPKDEEFLFDEQGDRKQQARDLSAQRKGL